MANIFNHILGPPGPSSLGSTNPSFLSGPSHNSGPSASSEEEQPKAKRTRVEPKPSLLAIWRKLNIKPIFAPAKLPPPPPLDSRLVENYKVSAYLQFQTPEGACSALYDSSSRTTSVSLRGDPIEGRVIVSNSTGKRILKLVSANYLYEPTEYKLTIADFQEVTLTILYHDTHDKTIVVTTSNFARYKTYKFSNGRNELLPGHRVLIFEGGYVSILDPDDDEDGLSRNYEHRMGKDIGRETVQNRYRVQWSDHNHWDLNEAREHNILLSHFTLGCNRLVKPPLFIDDLYVLLETMEFTVCTYPLII